MGYTLDQLLDATGVSEISGGRLIKKASAPEGQNLSKLAERIRRAVDATPEEFVESNQHELAEKTAAVAIIGRTLAELDYIDGASPEAVKTAAQSDIPSQAAFIKKALDAGHTPYEVAQFLEKHAGVKGWIGRRLQYGKARRGFKKSTQANVKASAKGERNLSEWQDLIRKSGGASEAERAKLLSRMRRDLGDQSALNAISSTTGHNFKNLEGFRNLQKAVPREAAQAGGAPLAASINIGGKQVGLTSAQVKKYKKPAAIAAGAGYMGHSLSDDGPKKSGRGPVIITG